MIKRETAGRPLSVSFDAKADGSSGYRLCVIVGFVDDTMRVQQRVINLGLFKETCEEILSTKMSDNIIHAITEVLQAPCKSIKVLCH